MAITNHTFVETNTKQAELKSKLEGQVQLLKSKIQAPSNAPAKAFNASSSSSNSAVLAMQSGSIEDFLLISLGEVADGARQDMIDFKSRLDGNTKHQNLVRELRSKMRGKDEDEIKDFIKAHPELKNSELLGKYKSGKIDFDALAEDVDSELESLNGISSTLSFGLQVLATRVTQAENLASTLFKKISDSAQQIIGNI